MEVEQALTVVGDGGERSYLLAVRDGRGILEEASRGAGPRLHERGLAPLYAGTPTVALVRAGLLDEHAPLLDAAFAGPEPVLLDYF